MYISVMARGLSRNRQAFLFRAQICYGLSQSCVAEAGTSLRPAIALSLW